MKEDKIERSVSFLGYFEGTERKKKPRSPKKKKAYIQNNTDTIFISKLLFSKWE